MVSYATIKEKLLRYNHLPGYAIAIANLILVLLFVFFAFRWLFHSDAATKVLLAYEVVKSGSIIPPDWYFVNGDIWLFFIHLPLILIGKAMDYSWSSYVVNTLFYVALYLAALLFFLRHFRVSFSSKILLFVMALSAYSTVNAMMVFGELAGITEPIFIFTFLGVILALEKREKGNTALYWLTGLLIFVFAAGAPGRSFIYNTAPALMVAFFLWIDKRSRKYLILFGTITLAFVLAYLVYHWMLLPNVEMKFSRNNLYFATYDEVWMNIDLFAKGLFFYFSLEGPRSLDVASFDGALYFFNFALVLFMLTATVKKMQLKTREVGFETILSFMTLYFLVVIGYLYIFANPLAKDATTFRYFRPLFYIVMIFTVLYVDRFNKPIKQIVIVVMLAHLTLINYKIYSSNSSFKELRHAHNNHEGVANYLMQHKLTYGFASYWNAGVTMALARNKSIVAPIHLHDFSPRRWLSAENWFHRTDTKKTFLLLAAGEYNGLKGSLNKFIPRDPLETLHIGNYVVLVYDTSREPLFKWQKEK